MVSIAAGTNHSLALCSDGTLITWGSNSAGQLGNGTTTSSSVPVAVTTVGTPLAGKTVVAMNAGAYHSLALCSDGTLVAWGINVSGQLGNSTKANSSVPVAVTTSGILAGKTVTSVAAGSMHSLANCTDGTPVAWGFNALGELGNGSTTNSSSPVATITGLLTSGEKFIQVASGQHAQHSLGLAATPFPIVSTLAPTTVGTTTAVVNGTVNANEGASAPSFNYGLDSSYGMNMPGTPASVTGSSPTAVSATLTGLLPNTTYHYQMVGASSSTSTGGADMTFTTLNGNLAGLTASTGSFSPSFSPSIYSYRGAVGAAVSSVVVTPTTSDSNATVAVNGTPVVSGSSSSPLPLGYGDTTINIVVTASDNISTVTYTLIITRDAPSTLNAVFSSATDIPLVSNGMVATGDTVNFTLNYTPTPGTSLTVVNNTGLGFIQGKYSNLAHGDVVNLTYNGITYHFVASYYGGTGNDLVLNWAGTRLVAWGDYSTSSIPMAVPATGTPLANHTVLALSAGNRFSLALFSDGTLASWGYNGDGELGNNTTTATSTPGVLATAGGPLVGKVVVAVSSGYYHSLVLCSDGSMASWGLNFNGQLGNSAFPNNATVPVPVVTSGTPLASKSVVAIAAGYGHNLVLCDDGTLAAWGLNSNGQLGNNTTDINRNYTPVLVTITGTPLAGKTVVSIAAGQYHNIALCSDGTVVTWGYNQFGQLGNSTPPYSSVPVAVNTSVVLAGKTVTAVAAGASHCLALCSDGTIAAWGNNAYGQLGNNMTTNSSVPVAVTTDGTPLAGKTIVRLMAGYYHSMVQCSDGTLVSWGDNGAGELGNSTVSSISSIPVAVDTSALASAESFVLATTSSNANGCLGLVSSPIPTVTTLAVTSVGATTAVLNGTVNANGGSSMVSFDYGLDTSYGINLAGTPTSITGTGSTAISTSLTSLTPSTTYHFRANGGSYSGSDLTFTTLSQLQNWRQQSFGTTTTTGLMADTADYDGDGIPNLLEFALNLNPTSASVLPVNGAVNGANFEYTYSRSSSAANAGTSYQVQWSSTLPATWSSIGVTQVILSDDTTTQQIKAYVPMNGAATMFVRLSVTAPP